METRRAHRAVRIDPEKRRTKAKRSRSRVHTSICGGGVRTSAFSELVTASPGKIGLVNCLSLRLPFRRQRNVTSLLGRGEEPWVSCLSIVEHAIGESSRFVLLFLLFFFFFFFPPLFFFFSSKKINVIDPSAISITLHSSSPISSSIFF